MKTVREWYESWMETLTNEEQERWTAEAPKGEEWPQTFTFGAMEAYASYLSSQARGATQPPFCPTHNELLSLGQDKGIWLYCPKVRGGQVCGFHVLWDEWVRGATQQWVSAMKLLREAQWTVHCGQFHQWKTLEQCTEKNCKVVMELLSSLPAPPKGTS